MENAVTQKQIDGLITTAEITTSRLGDKTCVTHVILKNGFELVATSACVDPSNYDKNIGRAICLKYIEAKLWELEGYLLQEKLYEASVN